MTQQSLRFLLSPGALWGNSFQRHTHVHTQFTQRPPTALEQSPRSNSWKPHGGLDMLTLVHKVFTQQLMSHLEILQLLSQSQSKAQATFFTPCAFTLLTLCVKCNNSISCFLYNNPSWKTLQFLQEAINFFVFLFFSVPSSAQIGQTEHCWMRGTCLFLCTHSG